MFIFFLFSTFHVFHIKKQENVTSYNYIVKMGVLKNELIIWYYQ